MSTHRQRVLVTSALPYADGPIHFGHITGAYLPADVYVRFRRMRGDEVLFVCGTDEHGVAVTLHAEQEGKPYQAYVDHWHDVQAGLFRTLGVEFDVFTGTSAGKNPYHAELSRHFFTRLLDNGYVLDKVEEQQFCDNHQRFLADRYVEGGCPKCGFDKARGDECPRCGSWLDAKELKNPRCKLCGTPPVLRQTRHWYLNLEKLRDEQIGPWFQARKAELKPNVVRFVEDALAETTLRPITRDLPWGVPVPLPDTVGKVLYVWFDAPIGYVSITQQLLAGRGDPEGWRKWWQSPDTQLVHFIGKDNIIFHMVVFPCMLYGVKESYVLPANVPANEFFNLEGRKFNKSSGWYIPLEEFFKKYSADATRYALLCMLPETADTDFLWREFQQRVNVDLADQLGNLVSRTLKFTERYFQSRVPAAGPNGAEETALFLATRNTAQAMEQAFLQFQFRKAAASLIELCWAANRYYDQKKPWETRAKDPADCARALRACAEVVRSLAILASPILPQGAERIWRMLGQSGSAASQAWSHAPAPGLPATEFTHGTVEVLFQKIPDEQIERELAVLRARSGEAAPSIPDKSGYQGSPMTTPTPPSQPAATPGSTPAPTPAPQPGAAAAAPAAGTFKPEITYEDFAKIDFRIGTIVVAEKHPKADRLLRLEVDLGTEKRQILAGIAGHYDPATLVGRQVVVVCNLAPRDIRGLKSFGMVLAAEGGGKMIVLKPADGEVPNGSIVK